MSTVGVLVDVERERGEQDVKWGVQSHDDFTWLAILGEEVGESNQAALDIRFQGGTLAALREELIQVAAVAVAFVEAIDRRKA